MSESNPDPLHLSLSGPTAVHSATLASRRFAGKAGIREPDAARLAILVEELVTNLYDHGGLGVDDTFEIVLAATSTEISVLLIDPGVAFDLDMAALDADVPQRGGGAGLKLVGAWAIRSEYRSSGGFNRMSVVLPRSPDGGDQARSPRRPSADSCEQGPE